MRPLVLLDVDGVLNALVRPDSADPQQGRATALARTWPIRWSPDVVAAVRDWTVRADVEWLTTWADAANGDLRTLLGLPELPVAGRPDGAAGATSRAGHDSLAGVTAAAPDLLTGRWWKLDVVRDRLAREPDRRLVWLDDDLGPQPDVQDWVRAHAECLLVAPDPAVGLSAADLEAVDRFLG